MNKIIIISLIILLLPLAAAQNIGGGGINTTIYTDSGSEFNMTGGGITSKLIIGSITANMSGGGITSHLGFFYEIGVTSLNVTIINTSFNTTSSTPTIWFNYTEGSLLANCSLYFNSVEVSNNSLVNKATNTGLTSSSQTDGIYQANINCTDNLGNTGQSNNITIIINLQNPWLNITSPANDSTSATAMLVITYQINDTNPDKCVLYWENTSYATTAVPSSGTYSFTYAENTVTGTYNYYITCNDTLGAQNTSEIMTISFDVKQTGGGGGGSSNEASITFESLATTQQVVLGQKLYIDVKLKSTYQTTITGTVTSYIDINNNGIQETDEDSCSFDASIKAESTLENRCVIQVKNSPPGTWTIRSRFNPSQQFSIETLIYNDAIKIITLTESEQKTNITFWIIIGIIVLGLIGAFIILIILPTRKKKKN